MTKLAALAFRHSTFGFRHLRNAIPRYYADMPLMPRIPPLACLLMLAMVTLALGCQSAPPPTAHAAAYPPDFALVFHVAGPSNATGPLGQSAQHVVEPSRKLRVAMGTGVTLNTYPPVTARLRPADMARLYQLAQDAGLTDPPPPFDPGESPSWITYRIRLTAHSHTYDHATDPELNPAAHQLLNELVRLRQGR